MAINCEIMPIGSVAPSFQIIDGSDLVLGSTFRVLDP